MCLIVLYRNPCKSMRQELKHTITSHFLVSICILKIRNIHENALLQGVSNFNAATEISRVKKKKTSRFIVCKTIGKSSGTTVGISIYCITVSIKTLNYEKKIVYA
jgi:hypothetical protein